ncbi:MAG: tryptophan 7-halogenase [Pirellulaceae bacterium]|nr:tryptophan 7-halogenase [Pirellulaceae bacterium]
MSDSSNIKQILIVGGGTAGWMTASYLNRFVRKVGCKVTLVESPEISTVGVGEATIPSLVKFVRNMKFDEDDFMRRCNATYKLGIEFSDWVHPNQSYWHPFGICGGIIDHLDLFHFWQKALRNGHDVGSYSSYSLQVQLCESLKAPRPLGGTSTIIQRGSYAYHLDAGLLGDYLADIGVTEGVEQIFDNVQHVELDQRGLIDHIETESGRRLSADLYIDCTGFRAQLIEKTLAVPFVDWSHQLLCDRAVVVDLPNDAKARPYTRSTALSAGWMWQIPLSHRLSCGYVYSSDHTDEDNATRELLDALGNQGAVTEAPRHLRFPVGHRRDFWHGNCISIGLAAGFIEPLESTGIHLAQKGIEMLLRFFPDQNYNQALIRQYNKCMQDFYEEVRDFIVLHYILSQREHEPFWRDCRSVPLPESLVGTLDIYDENGLIEIARDSVFHEISFYHILCGGDRLPRRNLPRADFSNFAVACEILEKIKTQNQELANTLPSHQTLMGWLHDEIDE